MAKITVEKREFTNETGSLIPYNVIKVSGILNGKEESIEKSVSKVEAMVLGMILGSQESLGEVSSSQGGKVEVRRVPKEQIEDDLFNFETE